MKHWPTEQESIVARLAGIEASLDELVADFDATTWRKSPLVANCIKSAREELDLSLKKFISKEREDGIHMANLAWLHVEFGRRLIDAETTEGLLGEGHFLELSEDRTTSSALLVKYFTRLEEQIIQLRKSITVRIEARRE